MHTLRFYHRKMHLNGFLLHLDFTFGRDKHTNDRFGSVLRLILETLTSKLIVTKIRQK